MATLENRELVRTYVRSLCNGGINGRYRGGTLFITRENELVYMRGAATKRTQFGPVTICHWDNRNKLFVINGDGFTDTSATNWQTHLRGMIQSAVRLDENPDFQQPWEFRIGKSHGARYLLTPFLALTSAGIDLNSIKVVEMQQDGWENIWHPIKNCLIIDSKTEIPLGKKLPKGWTLRSGATETRRVYEITYGGNRWQAEAHKKTVWRNRKTRQEYHYDPGSYRPSIHSRPSIHRIYDRIEEWRWVAGITEPNRGPLIWGVPAYEAGGWHTLIRRAQFAIPNGETARGVPVDPDARGWVERQHHLGASVFTARGPDGKRHMYVSAFDEQERGENPMYYLAQLPDTAKKTVTNYREAIQALAPPLVHKAWADKIPVYRQGDVFAIETDLTDEQVYKNCRSRVRREVALANTDPQFVAQVIAGTKTFPEAAEGEVTELVECELSPTHKRRVPNGPKAKRSLSIYRTGHTATEVVVAENGATYGRGTLYHDPYIEEPGRQPEHRTVPMFRPKKKQKWVLFVRNTVPRKKVRRETEAREEVTS